MSAQIANVFALFYAGRLAPELRVTADDLSPVVNALSTILPFVYIDPYLAAPAALGVAAGAKF